MSITFHIISKLWFINYSLIQHYTDSMLHKLYINNKLLFSVQKNYFDIILYVLLRTTYNSHHLLKTVLSKLTEHLSSDLSNL
jgi:hypothetical protein